MIYDAALALVYLAMSPKLKKNPFPPLPDFERGEGMVIWIHAVSLGETKAASTLLPEIEKNYPNSTLVITSVTETGHTAAKKYFPMAHHFFLPLDFTWTMRPFVKRIKPDLLLLIEGDYWANMLRFAKEEGAHIVSLSATISSRSSKRYRWFKRPFLYIDQFIVQNPLYLERYRSLGIPDEKLTIGGNIKFDLPVQKPQDLGTSGQVLTIGSTHDPEEKLLLKALEKVWTVHPKLQVLLAPRHPERFEEVRKLTDLYPNVRLIDKMGVLPSCYHAATLSIVGGSFTPGVGGHDVLEPTRYASYVLFGPHTETQTELATLVTRANLGRALPIEEIADAIIEFFQSPRDVAKRAGAFHKTLLGAAKKSWEKISLDNKSG